MNPQPLGGKISRKLNATLHRLDQVLIQVEGFKPLLEYNANSAAFEIKANFTSLIDALSQRQLVLLKQLDKVHKEKVSLIDRADAAVLSSSSAPFVSFRSERFLLPQAIATYGRIISHYSGHFADPSQPSACLPLAVEEEDDHEEAHEHPVVFKQMNCGSCTNVKPNLRPWLFTNTHDCSCSKQHYSTGERAMCNSDMMTKNHASTTSEGCCLTDSYSSIGNRTQPVNVCQRLSSASHLRNWLYSRDSQKPCDPVRNPNVGLYGRKQSCSSSRDASEYTGANESESITILSGSYRTGSLKDWLFCDTMELSDMPGLSTSRRQSSSVAPQPKPHTSLAPIVSGDLGNWLAPYLVNIPGTNTVPSTIQPTINTTTTTMPRVGLLPHEFTTSGPIDMKKWLHTGEPSESTPMEDFELETEEEEEEEEGSHSPASVQMSSDEPPTNTITDSVPDYCIYSQCRGGPGGPTCCGARIPSSEPPSSNIIGIATPVTTSCPNASTPNVLTHRSVPSNRENSNITDTETITVGNASVSAIVEQLNRIATSHWTKWLADSATPVTSPTTTTAAFRTRVNNKELGTHPSGDSQNWLHAPFPVNNNSNQSNTQNPTVLNDESTLRVQPFNLLANRTGLQSDAIVQSPFVGSLDGTDGAKLSSPRRRLVVASGKTGGGGHPKESTKTPQNIGVDDDVWLADKMSQLACKMQSLDDTWLLDTNDVDCVDSGGDTGITSSMPALPN